MIAENSSLPKFELSDANGNVVKSSDLKGKKCIIYFYPKDFTPGCTIEADEFSKDYKKFCEKMKIPYILLADTKTTVSKLFGVWGKKKFMGREYMGINRSTFLVNENGKIFKVFEKVKAKGHSKEVLEVFTNVK